MVESKKSVVMLGATGAVGGYVTETLLKMPEIETLTLLGRRSISDLNSTIVKQQVVDILNPKSYVDYLHGHQVAICTLGVGQPSKISKEDFLRIDKLAVLDFAKECKIAGIAHFELLASVGIEAKSSSFYLRTKGELVEELKALNFDRLSIFQPSMILTSNNRYGFSQGVLLKIWPLLKIFLIGGLRKYRGIKVEKLGEAIAKNIFTIRHGEEYLVWDDFQILTKDS